MKQLILSVGIWILAGISYKSLAQPPKESRSGTEEVIIRKKGSKDVDVRIQITDDNILINGKPMVEYKDDSVKVIFRKFDMEEVEHFRELGDAFEGMSKAFAPKGISKKRTFLGVSTEADDEGLEIESITQGSPAEKAGLKEDDKLLSLNDIPLKTPQQLYELITARKAGDKVKIAYKRDGRKKTATVTLAEKEENVRSFSWVERDGQRNVVTIPRVPEAPNVRFFERTPDGGNEMPGMSWSFSSRPKLGIKIQDTEEGNAVKVMSVDDDSPAAKSGLQPNDLIQEIDGKKVMNTDDAREVLQSVKDKSKYTIQVIRAGTPLKVDIVIPKKLKTATL